MYSTFCFSFIKFYIDMIKIFIDGLTSILT
jgi:hypothetical protein